MNRAVALRAAAAALALGAALAAQRWSELPAAFPAAPNALPQALRDRDCDATVLLVASHPDDRYLLPAAWLRRVHGARTAVLLATRGGGAQNSAGPETGDAFERVRTLEAEVGCARLGVELWQLGRPDAGFRRSAEDTLAEWGRQATIDDLARLLRRIRPDVVMTTHHNDEQHGHDLALIELLPHAFARARDAAFVSDAPPHDVASYWTGPDDMPARGELRVVVDAPDAELGMPLREHVYAILRDAHRSPGAPAPLDEVFAPTMRFLARASGSAAAPAAGASFALPSVLDAARSPLAPEARDELARRTAAVGAASTPPAQRLAVAELARRLAAVRAQLASPAAGDHADAARRLERRLAAAHRALALLAGVAVRAELAAGDAAAVPGEVLAARAQVDAPTGIAWRVRGEDGVLVEGADGFAPGADKPLRIHVPSALGHDPMAARFRAERFVPPLRLVVDLRIDGLELPIELPLRVALQPPVSLRPSPQALLLPTARRSLQFVVDVERHAAAPVVGEVELRAAAGYAIARDRAAVDLRAARQARVSFEVTAPASRRPGVDVLRIGMGDLRVELPVHKIDVVVPVDLSVGIVRSKDDTLPNVLGPGGLGIDVVELDDAAVAASAFHRLDAIVVDIRALRDRPQARASFGNLLAFAADAGKRLVVLYQKDVEFQPPGEGFVGAPFAPFVLGKRRVTRADAPVQMLLPDHPLLTHPNRIRAEDWDGWDQERALYLPAEWSPACDEVLAMGDPGQPVERGALLYARHGDGEYVYCALSLWRQLKKLHPGAVRLMANLLSSRRLPVSPR